MPATCKARLVCKQGLMKSYVFKHPKQFLRFALYFKIDGIFQRFNMSQKPRSAISAAVITTVGVGLIYLFARRRKDICRQIRLAWDYKNPLRHLTTEIVDNYEHCQKVATALKRDCSEYKVLGFDCEWVTVGGSRRPIALLQLSSHRGLCALIRLCCIKRVPKELREILEDETIFKVGVAAFDDANNLSRDYGIVVASTLDLRYLSLLTGNKPEGLGRLSKVLLKVELDKNWRTSCSNWEAEELTSKQIDYAAKDALVAVEIFKVLANKIQPRTFWEKKEDNWNTLTDTCQRYIDIKFTSGLAKTFSNSSKNRDKHNNKKLAKQISRNMSTRSRRLYDNCILQAPDGEILCTCDKKKAEWYILQNLGYEVSQEPYTVRLTFEPAGRAVGEVGKYYTTPKKNQCVVCGRQDAYIRKNVVPREYRKHFPIVMKTHTSHDVLLLCPQCHQISNISDLKLRSQLSEMCDAPLSGTEGGKNAVEVPRLRRVQSAARALIHNSHKIPLDRIQSLQKTVLAEYPPGTVLDNDILEEAANIVIVESVENYCAHGLKVVTKFQESFNGLTELERMWREHFLNTMRPKHLPELWSVTHNANRLEIRANEGRIEPTDMILAGLDPSNILSNNHTTKTK